MAQALGKGKEKERKAALGPESQWPYKYSDDTTLKSSSWASPTVGDVARELSPQLVA